MIRRLGQADGQALIALLRRAPAHNLYMLGNLETLGFDREFCAFWGDLDDAGRLRGCANRYMTGWSVFGEVDADWPGLALLIDGDAQGERLQDNPGGIGSIAPLLRRGVARSEVEELMQLDAADFRPAAEVGGIVVRRATRDDLPALYELYRHAGDMSRSIASTERPLRDGLVYVATAAESSGAPYEVLAAALTNAQTRDSAMIGGVYTRPAWRGRGISQAVCSALCRDLVAAGQTPFLYWKEPAAGRIYHKLGFRSIGRWRSLWLAPLE